MRMLVISKSIEMDVFAQRQLEWMDMIIHRNPVDFPLSSLIL